MVKFSAVTTAVCCLLVTRNSSASEAVMPSPSPFSNNKYVERRQTPLQQQQQIAESTRYNEYEEDEDEEDSLNSRSETHIADRIIQDRVSSSIDNSAIDIAHSQLADSTSEVDRLVQSIDAKDDKLDYRWVEPMCRPDDGRFALFPIKNPRMWEMYKKHVASFWTVSRYIYMYI